MSQDENIATQERLGEAAVKGNLDEFDHIFASGRRARAGVTGVAAGMRALGD